jgi:predicted PurR-regulated permease PerM
MSSKPDWRTMHLWQFQPVRDVLGIAAIIGLLWLGYKLSVVTVPILLALLLAYLFEPLVRAVTRRRWFSRQGAAITIIVALGLTLIAPLTIGTATAVIQGARVAQSIAATSTNFLTVMRFSRDAVDRPDTGRTVEVQAATDATHPPVMILGTKTEDDKQRQEAAAAQSAYQRLPTFLKGVAVRMVRTQQEAATVPTGPDGMPLPPPLEEGEEESSLLRLVDIGMTWVQNNASAIAATFGRQAIGTGAGALNAAVRTAQGIVSLTLLVGLTAFFFYYFSTGYGRVLAFWEGLIPERRKNRVVDMVERMDRVIAGFVRGRLTIAVCLIALYTVGYWLVGVPAPLLLGPIVGALAIIPFVSSLALPLAMILMVVEPEAAHWAWQQNWWWIVGGPLLVYGLERILDDYILTPAIQGKATDMDTPSILFASLAGGVLAGVYGLLIAIPVAACIKIMMKEVFWPRFRAWAEGKERDFLPISPRDSDKPPG